jgi:transposase InsO family protein
MSRLVVFMGLVECRLSCALVMASWSRASGCNALCAKPVLQGSSRSSVARRLSGSQECVSPMIWSTGGSRPPAPNVLWVADLTYLRTWEGWLYLAAVQDAFSRMIVGWAMAEHMRSELVLDALQMGLERRCPDPGLIHHSDQGSQYVSLTFGQKARDAGVAVSMGSRGDCYDNAVAESFFATIKKELVHRQPWPTRRELSSAIFEYIEAFYNRQRRHSTLDYLSPEQYENQSTTTAIN